MAASLSLLLFGSLLCVAGAQHSYFNLSMVHRGGVDLALMQVFQKPTPFHYRFLKTEGLKETNSGNGAKYVHHRFSLKPTTCAKGTADHEQTCPYREDRALMDCAVCYKTTSDQIEWTPQPYVHCIQKPRLTQELQTFRKSVCEDMVYLSGGDTLGRSLD